MPNKSTAYFISLSASAARVFDYFTANDAVLPSGAAASAKGRNNHPLVVYPQAQVTPVDFLGVFPDAGVMKVSLLWSSTVNVGDVFWQLAWERDNASFFVPQENLDVDNFAPFKGVIAPAPLASGLLRETTLTFTNAERGGILQGEAYRLRVRRNGLFIADTMLAEAQLLRVILGV